MKTNGGQTVSAPRQRVLIYGAGVVGQIYGGRIAAAGHDVTLLARGVAAEGLVARGVLLERDDGRVCAARPPVLDEACAGDYYDSVLVTVRRDQLDDVVPTLSRLAADRVVFLLNNPLGLGSLRDRIGPERAIFAFPGVGGYRTRDGSIRYIEIPQQKTTIERRGGAEQPMVRLLRSADLPVELNDDIEGWLQTHAVFISGMEAAILECGGDASALAADLGRVTNMVAAVGEGFRALARSGVTVTPMPLRIIFTRMPRFLAARYWRRQLRGVVGTVALAPHVRASSDSELPVLCSDVRRLLADAGPVPRLSRLLEVAAPCYTMHHH